jgi:hypothetical protein
MPTTSASPLQRRRWRAAPSRPSTESVPTPQVGLAWQTCYFLITNGVPVLALVGWWVASHYQSAYIVPSPTDVLARTWDLIVRGRAGRVLVRWPGRVVVGGGAEIPGGCVRV